MSVDHVIFTCMLCPGQSEDELNELHVYHVTFICMLCPGQSEDELNDLSVYHVTFTCTLCSGKSEDELDELSVYHVTFTCPLCPGKSEDELDELSRTHCVPTDFLQLKETEDPRQEFGIFSRTSLPVNHSFGPYTAIVCQRDEGPSVVKVMPAVNQRLNSHVLGKHINTVEIGSCKQNPPQYCRQTLVIYVGGNYF